MCVVCVLVHMNPCEVVGPSHAYEARWTRTFWFYFSACDTFQSTKTLKIHLQLSAVKAETLRQHPILMRSIRATHGVAMLMMTGHQGDLFTSMDPKDAHFPNLETLKFLRSSFRGIQRLPVPWLPAPVCSPQR